VAAIVGGRDVSVAGAMVAVLSSTIGAGGGSPGWQADRAIRMRRKINNKPREQIRQLREGWR
jgi:hypothetical protein